MIVKHLEYIHLQIPLKHYFQTSATRINVRDVGILKLYDEEGYIGYGEVSSFLTPWYTNETLVSDEYVIGQMVSKLLKGKKMTHPQNVIKLLQPIIGHQMLKAGIETALWDLYGKRNNCSLATLLGSSSECVDVGIAIGAHENVEETKQEIYQYLEKGYKRFKLKVKNGEERQLLSKIRLEFPQIPLMFDANGCYGEEDIERLQTLDELELLMIEQPFQSDRWDLSQKLQSKIKTPICLDESIETFLDCETMISKKAAYIANMKYSRVGGISNALLFTDYLVTNHARCWVGGMIETGISKAVTLAIASLPTYTIPGDITASERFWHKDIVTKPIEIQNGSITIPNKPGIGIEVDEEALEHYTIRKMLIW